MDDQTLRNLTPRYPLLLVELLPRSSKSSSGIIMPDDTNKPVHEGVVLRTWTPWDKPVDSLRFKDHGHIEWLATQHGQPESAWQSIAAAAKELIAATKNMFRWTESALKQGDVILFPHWAPKALETDSKVVLISEMDVMGVLKADTVATRAHLTQALSSDKFLITIGKAWMYGADALLEEFIIVPRTALTKSGSTDTTHV